VSPHRRKRTFRSNQASRSRRAELPAPGRHRATPAPLASAPMFHAEPASVRASATGALGAALVMSAAATLALTPTMSTAVRLLENALVMDGTTWSTPSPGFVQSAINDFIAPTLGGSYTGIAVTTPEQALGINQSVQQGLADLQAAMAQQQQNDPGAPYVVFGYSQSAVIENLEKAQLEQQKAAGQPVPNVTFVEIGDGNRPNGGIAERFAGLTIPFADFTFNGAAPNNTQNGIPTIDIARQYDGLADFPQYPIDVVADANALLGIVFVHLLYGEEVSLNPSSPNYVPGTTVQQDGDTTYYFIPTAQLPLLDPLRVLGVPESVLDIVQPFLKVLVEAGYDRSIPFGQPTPAQLIPVLDPVTLTLQLGEAALQGANNAAAIAGTQLPGYTALSNLLTTAESRSAAAIGAPYGAQVSAINDAFNPIQTFDQLEGPPARAFDGIVNGLGIPTVLNAVLDATLFKLTALVENDILFPQTAATADIPNTTALTPNLVTTRLQHTPNTLGSNVAAPTGPAATPRSPRKTTITWSPPRARTQTELTDSRVAQDATQTPASADPSTSTRLHRPKSTSSRPQHSHTSSPPTSNGTPTTASSSSHEPSNKPKPHSQN
jgi:hypothetical protein